ncbi:unnamed protein product [Clavelina lepadiformis]|uniref:Uncharacterized protein n=1 Tax=Clavelina lepadiformis TaxID=159417 RepID=A0ABP0G9Y1_CLALP
MYMKKLNLSFNNLGDDGASHISTCLSKIKELRIGRCKIRASGIKSISNAISKLPEPIRYLNLSGNKFGDAGIPFIMSCLDKIEKLHMTDCNITEEGVRVIIEHIKTCSNLPKVLEFNYDKMNPSKMLRCGLDQLDNANFSNLDLTPVGWEALAAAINKLPEPIHFLNLSGIKFGDAGVPFIMSCLDKIEKLYMIDCNITEEGVRVIIERMKNCSNLPKVLEFNYDKMNRSEVLRCGLDLLDNDNFSNLDLTAVGVEALAAAINKLPQPIHFLNVSGNKFGDAGVPFIMSCLDKIEKLYMTDCNITEEGVRVIIERMKNCSNLPKVLEFNYDKMNRSEVLRCGLDLLENDNFSHLHLTAVGVEALAAAINKLPQPAAHTRAKAFTIKKEGTSPRVEAKINSIYQVLLDAYLSHDDIADENLGRQECETTRREFTERLAAVPDVSDCRSTSIHSTASSVRCEQLSSKLNRPAGRPRNLRNTTKRQTQETAERGKGKDIQQEAERQFQEANQTSETTQDSLRQKQQELYVAQETARTMAQATKFAESSVAECLDPAPLLQPSSPTASQSTTQLQLPTSSECICIFCQYWIVLRNFIVAEQFSKSELLKD